jgi:Ca2+-binding EF-hand superfamily protein
VADGQYALTAEEMLQLFAKLDKDRSGTVGMGEMIDVFDWVDNGALTVRDCQGNMYPHRWIGDGFW